MDSYMAEKRYMTKRTAPHRRYARNPRQGGLRRLLAFQLLVSIILLLIIIIAKCINISVTDFITGQVRYALTHNVELGSIYTYAESMVSDIKNSILPDPAEKRGTKSVAAADDLLKANETDHTVSEPDSSENVDVLPEEPQLSVLSPKSSVLAASSGDVDAYAPATAGTYGMISPINGTLATPFGEIEGPSGIVRMHNGIDISVETMSDVKAVLDGIVADSGSAPGYGNFVSIKHDNGLTTVYGNCSDIAVNKNDPVKKGDLIAGVGGDSMTGGSHLHFEVWYEDDPVDPLEYITVTAG